METFFSFILSVAANVVAHCIDKWLDEQLKAGKHYPLVSKTPRGIRSTVGLLAC